MPHFRRSSRHARAAVKGTCPPASSRVPALAEGGVLGVDVGGTRVLVCNVAGEHYAVSNVCPHARVPLSEGSLDGSTITCPLHGARFDVRTGRCLRGPAADDLSVYTVRTVDGEVLIEL